MTMIKSNTQSSDLRKIQFHDAAVGYENLWATPLAARGVTP